MGADVLRACVERAFGTDAEGRVHRFLLENTPPNPAGDGARWRDFFEACARWREAFVLWAESAFVSGVHGWNLELAVYKLRLPEGDWTEYLCRATLLAAAEGLGPAERNSLMAGWKTGDSFSSGLWFRDFDMETFTELTRAQWLGELEDLLNRSWEAYRRGPEPGPAYRREMERNYPRLAEALAHLAREAGDCEAARVNRHGGDETVWYFAKDRGAFYLTRLVDSM